MIGWRRRTLLGRVETSFSRNESESAASENKSSGIVMPRDASDKFPTVGREVESLPMKRRFSY